MPLRWGDGADRVGVIVGAQQRSGGDDLQKGKGAGAMYRDVPRMIAMTATCSTERKCDAARG
jgi:hypothetical protein